MKINQAFPDFAAEARQDVCHLLDNHVQEIAETLVT